MKTSCNDIAFSEWKRWGCKWYLQPLVLNAASSMPACVQYSDMLMKDALTAVGFMSKLIPLFESTGTWIFHLFRLYFWFAMQIRRIPPLWPDCAYNVILGFEFVLAWVMCSKNQSARFETNTTIQYAWCVHALIASAIPIRTSQYSVYPVDWKRDNTYRPAPKPAKVYPFTLDPFQKQAIEYIERNESVLVSAHTSAGKVSAYGVRSRCYQFVILLGATHVAICPVANQTCYWRYWVQFTLLHLIAPKFELILTLL